MRRSLERLAEAYANLKGKATGRQKQVLDAVDPALNETDLDESGKILYQAALAAGLVSPAVHGLVDLGLGSSNAANSVELLANPLLASMPIGTSILGAHLGTLGVPTDLELERSKIDPLKEQVTQDMKGGMTPQEANEKFGYAKQKIMDEMPSKIAAKNKSLKSRRLAGAAFGAIIPALISQQLMKDE